MLTGGLFEKNLTSMLIIRVSAGLLRVSQKNVKNACFLRRKKEPKYKTRAVSPTIETSRGEIGHDSRAAIVRKTTPKSESVGELDMEKI